MFSVFLESKWFKDIANENIEHETKKNTYKKLLILILQIFWHVPINQMKSGPTC